MFVFATLLFIFCIFIGLVWAAAHDEKRSSTSMPPTSSKPSIIKVVYFYLVSLISLMMVVFSTADLVNLGLKTWIFTSADEPAYYQSPCYAPVAPMMENNQPTKEADCETSAKKQRSIEVKAQMIQKQRDAVRDLAFLIVGLPLFAYHWRTIRKESKND